MKDREKNFWKKFLGLRAKACCYLTDDNDERKKAKKYTRRLIKRNFKIRISA